MSPTTKQRSILGLDLVRFAAAVGVVLYHLAWWWWLPGVAGEQGRVLHEGLAPLREPFRWGWVGVQTFFTLSGFVIAFSADGKSASAFLKGRILRLYPAAWICASCTLIAAKWAQSGVFGEYLGSLTLWIYGPWIDGVYWTLSVEIAFYALVACVLLFGGRLRTLGAALGTVSTLFWIIRVLDFVTGEHAKPILAMAEGTQTGKLLLLATGTYFATGILLWSLAFEGSTPRKRMLLLVFAIASVVASTGDGHYKISVEGGHRWQMIEPGLFWLVGLFAIVMSIRWNDWFWIRFGHRSAQIRLAGLVTYPLYLVHSEIGRTIMVEARSLGAFPALVLALGTVLLLALTIVKLEQYPRRCLQWLFAIRARSQPLALADLP